MKLRQGIVVATHPEDHSVDLVMIDDGSRMVGVQVLTPNGSQRTGTFHMAPVTREGDKWDISKRTDQDQYAVVGFINTHPVVVGYLFPQINQMNLKSDRTFYFRHHSDVTVRVNEFGALSINHPGGLGISIGTPGAPEGQDDSAADEQGISRNDNIYPDLTISLRGNNSSKPGAFSLSVGPDGRLSISSRESITIGASESMTLIAKKLTLQAEKIRMETPLVEVAGDVLTDQGVSHNTHVHGGIVRGGADTDGPH